MKRLCFSFLIILLLAGCASNSTVDISEHVSDIPSVDVNSPSEPPFDMTSYIDMVEELHKHIANNALAIGNMGVWETNFLESLGRTSFILKPAPVKILASAVDNLLFRW